MQDVDVPLGVRSNCSMLAIPPVMPVLTVVTYASRPCGQLKANACTCGQLKASACNPWFQVPVGSKHDVCNLFT